MRRDQHHWAESNRAKGADSPPVICNQTARGALSSSCHVDAGGSKAFGDHEARDDARNEVGSSQHVPSRGIATLRPHSPWPPPVASRRRMASTRLPWLLVSAAGKSRMKTRLSKIATIAYRVRVNGRGRTPEGHRAVPDVAERPFAASTCASRSPSERAGEAIDVPPYQVEL